MEMRGAQRGRKRKTREEEREEKDEESEIKRNIVCDCVDIRNTLVLTSQSGTSSNWPSIGFMSRSSGTNGE